MCCDGISSARRSACLFSSIFSQSFSYCILFVRPQHSQYRSARTFKPSALDIVMGTLSDITAYAGNTMKRQSNSSTGYQSLGSPSSVKKTADKENAGQAKSPHFMTPTLSSSIQYVATTSVTPQPSPKLGDPKSNTAWMKSAAKRVGLRRIGDGTPRSKKEGQLKSPKTISFPDKVNLSSDSHQIRY